MAKTSLISGKNDSPTKPNHPYPRPRILRPLLLRVGSAPATHARLRRHNRESFISPSETPEIAPWTAGQCNLHQPRRECRSTGVVIDRHLLCTFHPLR